jgi:hypothetical protein
MQGVICLQGVAWGFTILLVIITIGLILSLLRWILNPKKTVAKINNLLKNI